MPARTGTQLVAPPLPSDTVMPPVTAEQEDPVANERSCGCVEVLCLKYDDRDGNGARSVHNAPWKAVDGVRSGRVNLHRTTMHAAKGAPGGGAGEHGGGSGG